MQSNTMIGVTTVNILRVGVLLTFESSHICLQAMVVNRRFSCLQYDCSLTPTENIGLPDSLPSRFDLLFIVLDQMDAEIDCQNLRACAMYAPLLHPGRRCRYASIQFLYNSEMYYNVIQVIAFTRSSVVADIVSLRGSLQFPLSNRIACIISMLWDI